MRSVFAAVVAVVAGAQAQAAAPTDAWREAFELRGYQLGMTLDAFRKAKFPDAQRWPGARPVCTGDEESARPAYFAVARTAALQRTGAVACRFYVEGSTAQEAGLLIASRPTLVEFYFLPPEPEAEPRLFLIAASGPVMHFDRTETWLKRNLGQPNDRQEAEVDTPSGRPFLNQSIIWDNGISTATLRQFSDGIEKMELQLSLRPLAELAAK
ncbi:MAG TPA: hypothetical protein VEH84_14200 [Alphaproteobacteria bacterium]|nr:hypothetical protein [Alphaproteobacteria bacterium]